MTEVEKLRQEIHELQSWAADLVFCLHEHGVQDIPYPPGRVDAPKANLIGSGKVTKI